VSLWLPLHGARHDAERTPPVCTPTPTLTLLPNIQYVRKDCRWDRLLKRSVRSECRSDSRRSAGQEVR
jgi:hypothetical protein